MLHKILHESDAKLAFYNRLHPVADAFAYFGGINPIFLHLYGKYYYYDLVKSLSYMNAFKNKFHWETSEWNKWIIAFHRDRWWPFWLLRSRKFRPPFQKRHTSFFYKYLKVPKTTVKPYLQKVGHGMRVLDPTSKATSHYLSWWIGPLEARLFYPPPSNSRCLDLAVSWTSMMRIYPEREWSSRIWS